MIVRLDGDQPQYDGVWRTATTQFSHRADGHVLHPVLLTEGGLEVSARLGVVVHARASLDHGGAGARRPDTIAGLEGDARGVAYPFDLARLSACRHEEGVVVASNPDRSRHGHTAAAGGREQYVLLIGERREFVDHDSSSIGSALSTAEGLTVVATPEHAP